MSSQLATRNFSLNSGSPRSPKFPQLFHQRRNSSQVWRGAWLARKFERVKRPRVPRSSSPRQNLTRAITPFLSGVRAIQRTDYRGHRAKIVRPGPKIKGRSGTTTTPSPSLAFVLFDRRSFILCHEKILFLGTIVVAPAFP